MFGSVGNYNVVISADHGFGSREDSFLYRYVGVDRCEAVSRAEQEVNKKFRFGDYVNVWIADVRKDAVPSEPCWSLKGGMT